MRAGQKANQLLDQAGVCILLSTWRSRDTCLPPSVSIIANIPLVLDSLQLSCTQPKGRGWLQGLPQSDLERRQGQATFLGHKPPLHYNCCPSYQYASQIS